MKYRDAKELHSGDQVQRKRDKVFFIVNDVEIFGQYKKVKLNCVAENGSYETLYNDEIE
jgi:hypothetical protein